MAENNKPADSGAATRSGSAPAMAPGSPPGEPGNAPAAIPAKQSVPAFGGNPTGRKSKFRFPADTAQGIEERRRADSDRKAAARTQAAKLVEPPPLPAAGLDRAVRAPADPVATPGNGEIAFPVVAPVEVVVPWTPADIREITDELVDLSEANRLSEFLTVAKEAKLPESLLREIEADAKFPAKSKAGVKTAIAACAAKWLNKSGISAKNKEEAALLFFSAGIWMQGRRMRSKLDDLIREDKERKKKLEAKAKTSVTLPAA